MRTILLLAVAIAAAPLTAVAGHSAVGGWVPIAPWPWFSPWGGGYPPAWGYDSLAPCLRTVNCLSDGQLRRFIERYERNHGGRLTLDSPSFTPAPLPRDVAPTPEAHIQPRYRDASQIRSEFRHSGQALTVPPAGGDATRRPSDR